MLQFFLFWQNARILLLFDLYMLPEPDWSADVPAYLQLAVWETSGILAQIFPFLRFTEYEVAALAHFYWV